MQFSKDTVFLNIDVKDQTEFFDYLTNIAYQQEITSDSEQLKKDLLAREAQGSTGFENMIAIPHTRSKAVKKPIVYFIKTKSPIEWKALDNNLTQYFFIILMPDSEEIGSYFMDILSNIATVLMNQEFLSALNGAHNQEQIIKILNKYLFLEKENDISAQQSLDTNNDYYLALVACTCGLAHTYLAEQKLYQYAKENNINIKVETIGVKGNLNKIQKEDLNKAKGVIIAIDKNVDISHIVHNNIVKLRTIDVVKNPNKVFQMFYTKETFNKKVGDFFKISLFQSLHQSFGKTHHVIGFIAVLIGILLYIQSFYNNQTITVLAKMFQYSMLIVPSIILYVMIYYFIKDELWSFSIGLIVLGYCIYYKITITDDSITWNSSQSFGVLALFYIIIITVPYFRLTHSVQTYLKSKSFIWHDLFRFYNLLGILSLLTVSLFYLNNYFSYASEKAFSYAFYYEYNYWWIRTIIVLIVGVMITYDFGGPVNKWSITFATLLFVCSAYYDINYLLLTGWTTVALFIPAPSFALYLRAQIHKKSLSEVEYQLSYEAWKLGWKGISEGSLWFVENYKWRFRISTILMVILASFIIGFLHLRFYGGLNNVLGTIVGFSMANYLYFGNLGWLIVTTTVPLVGGLLYSLTMPARTKQ